MSDTRPIVRCEVRGCPVIGRFSSGYCPMHQAEAPRRPTLAEAWETDPGGQP